MAKKMRLYNSFTLKKCQKGACIAEDHISQLPDEVLVYILSFLTVKEASYTSVLSRRWLGLWKYIHRLDFDATKPLDEVASQPKLRKRQMRKYLRWVNCTLQMCQEQRLDQFRKVQRLELDLLKGGSFFRPFNYCYTFPARLLGLGDSADSSSCIPHSNNLQILSLVKQNYKSLKVLLLKSVNVTGEVLEFFLHNCPFLEKMVVHGSGTLVKFEVVGPSLKLRHLEIRYCCNVKSLKICDTNLITLRTLTGKNLLLKNVPMLVEVEFLGTPYTHLLNDISSRLLFVLSQLEVHTVHASCSLEDQSLLGCTSIIRAAPQLKEFELRFRLSLENLEHYKFPALTKLKKFVLSTFGLEDQSLLGCTSIIRAAPQLKEFELRYFGSIATFHIVLDEACENGKVAVARVKMEESTVVAFDQEVWRRKQLCRMTHL